MGNKRAGTISSIGYVAIMVNARLYGAHRLIWMMIHGSFPPDQLDHVNHHRDDNRIDNLCLATNKENCRNRSISSINTSGFTGVYLNQRSGKWQAMIKVDGKQIHLGCFKNKLKAIKARKEASKKYNFHANHGATI